MSINVVKHILWIIICLPIFFFGFYLFTRLYRDFYTIRRIDEKKKKEKENELARYNKFQEQYKKDHPGEF